MKLKKLSQYLLAIALVFAFSMPSAQAADIRFTQDGGGSISIGADEEVQNLYTAGNIVSINADVQKSLHAGGNAVTISGNVENNAYVGAGTVIVNGNIGGSLHGGGGTIVIEGEITDDLIIAGGNINIAKSASIGGDLMAAGGTLNIEAPVTGNIYVSGGEVFINSEIKGNVVMKSVDNLKLGSNAVINGNLTYNSPREAKFDDNASVLGSIDYNTKKGYEAPAKAQVAGILFAIFSITLLIKLIGLIIIGFIFAYLFKKYTDKTVNESLKKFWPSLGIGFAALILTPIAIVLLLFTIVGTWLAILIASIYFLALLLAGVIAPLAFGSWIIKLIKKEKTYKVGWLEILVGVILLTAIKLIPILGWIACLILFLISLGAIYRLVYKAVRS